MKEYIVSVKISTEIQLVVEASSEAEASNVALQKEFVIAEKSGIPEVVIRNEVVTLSRVGITPKNSSVLTEITNPKLKKRLKK